MNSAHYFHMGKSKNNSFNPMGAIQNNTANTTSSEEMLSEFGALYFLWGYCKYYSANPMGFIQIITTQTIVGV